MSQETSNLMTPRTSSTQLPKLSSGPKGGFEMSINITRGKPDPVIEDIKHVLCPYEKDHPKAKIDMYRQNSASVRIRIIDSAFDGMNKKERNDLIWKYLEPISDESQGDISMLVLLTPTEVKKSFANMEFEDPVPSML
jgi:hypothetical protein